MKKLEKQKKHQQRTIAEMFQLFSNKFTKLSERAKIRS